MVVPSFDMELRFSMVNIPVLSLFMTYHWVCNWINMTRVTSGAGNIPTRAEVLAREQWNYTLSEVGRVIDYKENVALK
jgi:hypothetical protein